LWEPDKKLSDDDNIDLVSPFFEKEVLKAQENNLITRFSSDLIDSGFVVLQYGDDTNFCINHDPEQSINLKMLLYMLEMMLVLKINYMKLDIVVIGGDNNIVAL
jgi:hypothetical protein